MRSRKYIAIIIAATLLSGCSSKNSTSEEDSVSVVEESSEVKTEAPERTPYLNDYTKKWGYNHLNAIEQEVYRAIYETVVREGREDSFGPYEIDVTKYDVSTDLFYKAYMAVNTDNPQLFAFPDSIAMKESGDEQVKIVRFIPNRSASEVDVDYIEYTAQCIASPSEGLRTDYYRIKEIHDWIAAHTRYNCSGAAYENAVDGVLMYGEAQCTGYAKTFSYFMQMLGYDCVCVPGEAKSASGKIESHMWNKVKVQDNWYNVDVTWDDAENGVIYDYFLKSDEQFSETHTPSTENYLPTAEIEYIEERV